VCKVGFDRAFGHSHEVGDRGQGQVAQVVENRRLPLPEGQVTKSAQRVDATAAERCVDDPFDVRPGIGVMTTFPFLT